LQRPAGRETFCQPCARLRGETIRGCPDQHPKAGCIVAQNEASTNTARCGQRPDVIYERLIWDCAVADYSLLRSNLMLLFRYAHLAFIRNYLLSCPARVSVVAAVQLVSVMSPANAVPIEPETFPLSGEGGLVSQARDQHDIVVYGRALSQIGVAVSGSQGVVGYKTLRIGR